MRACGANGTSVHQRLHFHRSGARTPSLGLLTGIHACMWCEWNFCPSTSAFP